MIQGSNTGRGSRFFSSPKCPDWLGGPPILFFFDGYEAYFLGVKLRGQEVNHPPYREDFTFPFLVSWVYP